MALQTFIVIDLIIYYFHSKNKDMGKKRKAERGTAKRTPFLPPQMGYLSLLQ